jgi:light-regulated signal transduction histidine kinase (bacteriophytochrome)
VIKDLRVAIEETGAAVTFDSLPVVRARPFQFKQVFQNLIGNAIKFHDGKPPAIHVCAERKKSSWVFSVIDNGISIAPENVERVFAIFQRLHTRMDYPGNGIGLAICKKIVEQHGGKIWMEPNATPGATFKFTWPAGTLGRL